MKTIEFMLNGNRIAIASEPLRRLIDVLREDLGLTGTKEGCGEGECGACLVLLDGRAVNACLVPVEVVHGREVTTIEGYSGTERFKVLRDCFEKAGSVQCGFCTPGMILAAESLLAEDPDADEAGIREALSGNLCRCTGYNMIVEAVMAAAREGKGLWKKAGGL